MRIALTNTLQYPSLAPNERDFDAFESDIAIDNRQRAFRGLYSPVQPHNASITMDFQLTNS